MFVLWDETNQVPSLAFPPQVWQHQASRCSISPWRQDFEIRKWNWFIQNADTFTVTDRQQWIRLTQRLHDMKASRSLVIPSHGPLVGLQTSVAPHLVLLGIKTIRDPNICIVSLASCVPESKMFQVANCQPWNAILMSYLLQVRPVSSEVEESLRFGRSIVVLGQWFGAGVYEGLRRQV